jgi:hypothetical protein
VKRLRYNITLLVTISPKQSPSSLECEEGTRFEVGISALVWCIDKIQALVRHVLERLKRGIFNKRVKLAIGPSATMQKLVEILDFDDENDEEHVGVEQRLIETILEVCDTTKTHWKRESHNGRISKNVYFVVSTRFG